MATFSPAVRSTASFLLWVAILSLLEFRAVDLIQGRNYNAEVDVINGVLSGHPYWKAYQNRLLGPELLNWLAHLSGAPMVAVYRSFCFALLCLANVVGGAFLRRRYGCAWGCLVAYGGLFVAFQDSGWLYLWDYVDLTTMLLFAWAVVVGSWRLWQFALLFLVELANRESAQFIALWLVLNSLCPEVSPDNFRKRWVDLPRLLVGVTLGVLGTGWTQWVRDTFCQGETGIVPRKEIVELAGGQFLMGRVTMDLLSDPWNLEAMTLGALLLTLPLLLWQAWRPLGRRAWRVAVLLAAMVAANLCLSFIYELRVWLALLPFAVCLAYRWQMANVSPSAELLPPEKKMLSRHLAG